MNYNVVAIGEPASSVKKEPAWSQAKGSSAVGVNVKTTKKPVPPPPPPKPVLRKANEERFLEESALPKNTGEKNLVKADASRKVPAKAQEPLNAETKVLRGALGRLEKGAEETVKVQQSCNAANFLSEKQVDVPNNWETGGKSSIARISEVNPTCKAETKVKQLLDTENSIPECPKNKQFGQANEIPNTEKKQSKMGGENQETVALRPVESTQALEQRKGMANGVPTFHKYKEADNINQPPRINFKSAIVGDLDQNQEAMMTIELSNTHEQLNLNIKNNAEHTAPKDARNIQKVTTMNENYSSRSDIAQIQEKVHNERNAKVQERTKHEKSRINYSGKVTMGGPDADFDGSETLPGAKTEQHINAMKSEAEEILTFYKSLREKNDATAKKIAGLNADKEAVRQRIRALLNKTTTATGPDHDAYQMMRKTSRTYEPVDVRRSSPLKTSKTSMEVTLDEGGGRGKLPTSISLTLNTKTGKVSEEVED